MKNKLSVWRWILPLLFLFTSLSTLSQACPPPEEQKQRLAGQFSMMINDSTKCEAYPYLSADGLRLYFTTDREGGFGRLYFCSRNSVSENFNAPKPLSKKIADGYYAATLTDDELTLYCSREGEIFISTRKSLNDEFSAPEQINDFAAGWKFAPAISPDGNEIIVIHSADGDDEAVHYRKKTSGKFEETYRLETPGGEEPDPGQFSKDGLFFYLSFEQKTTAGTTPVDFQQKIIRYKRNSLTESFIYYSEVNELNNDLRNHQPTMNEDGTIFIVASTTKNLWAENDLRMINMGYYPSSVIKCVEESLEEVDTVFKFSLSDNVFKFQLDTAITLWVCGGSFVEIEQIVYVDEEITEKPSAFDKIDAPVQVKIYPNPFTDNLIITLPDKNRDAVFELLDISGKKLMSTKLTSTTNRVQFNKAVTGLLVYRITSLGGQLISTGKLVKK